MSERSRELISALPRKEISTRTFENELNRVQSLRQDHLDRKRARADQNWRRMQRTIRLLLEDLLQYFWGESVLSGAGRR